MEYLTDGNNALKAVEMAIEESESEKITQYAVYCKKIMEINKYLEKLVEEEYNAVKVAKV